MTERGTEAENPRLAEFLSIFANAGDLGRGQAEGHVARVCWIGIRLADELRLPPEARVDVYFTTLLIHGGCTAGSAKLAAFIASDELAAQRDFCLCAPENLVEVLACMKRNVAPNASLPKRLQGVVRMLARGEEMMTGVNGGCADVGSRIAGRLGCRTERHERSARSAKRGRAAGRASSAV